jgi:HSP20 family molecular chaperone IbpA
VFAELPGVDEKDIELTVTDGALIIQGEKVDRRPCPAPSRASFPVDVTAC